MLVSGSPYEPYCGSTVNTAKTAADGVLVINRYDWAYYDKRGKEEVGEYEGEGILDPHCAGLVDLELAKEQVSQWKDKAQVDRTHSEGGTWLYIPHAEYLFGRFGFDEKHTAAQSFLLFTASTYFMRTGFRGLSRSIRKDESIEELFTRHLNAGMQFEGLKTLRDMASIIPRRNLVPEEPNCLGPFDSSESLLKPSDWDALRTYASVERDPNQVRTFAKPLRDQVFDLLNDMALTCLMRFVEPIRSADSIQAVATLLCPNYTKDWTFDKLIYPYSIGTKEKPIEGFDVQSMESCITKFLLRKCGESGLLEDRECIGRVHQCMVCILIETLEQAVNAAIGNVHVNVVPSDIRLGVCNDRALLQGFGLCRMYWYGAK